MNNILKVSVKDIPEVVQAMEKASKEIKRLNNKIQDLQADYGNKAQVERDLLEEENKRLNNIIKEVREYIESDYIVEEVGVGISYITIDKEKLLEILDKGE